MRRTGGVLAIIGLAALPVWAGEVHTRSTAGAWSSDSRTGVLRASIPNDTGYSFWLLGERVNLSAPVTVIAQIRYANHVDYGGVGVALMDPAATGTAQRHIRIELSDRQDHVAVGGWLGNENAYGSGGVKATGRDIKVGDWYELAIKIDGIRVTGYLDGAEMWSGDVPELRQLPGSLVVAPFVIEADAEIKVTVRASAPPPRVDPPPPPPQTGNVQVKIEAYGYDETDGSDVGWNRGYPSPSLDDDPRRRGKPNAEWNGSYTVRGDQLCVRVDNLKAPYTPVHSIAIGYMVSLDGTTFADGQRAKRIIVHKFSGQPRQTSAEKCERLAAGSGTVAPPSPPDAQPMPPINRISDLLPNKSRKQTAIEKAFKAAIATASNDDKRRMFLNPGEWILVVGKFHLLLEPFTQKWHFYDRLHDSWEPTGYRAGEATFTVARGKIKVIKRRGRR
jgi:hypothetical protein